MVDDVLLVNDGTMVRAMRFLFWKMGLVVEPAGAAGVAALLAHRERFAGALVATPLCGSNLTGQQIRRWLLEDASDREFTACRCAKSYNWGIRRCGRWPNRSKIPARRR